ncbi:MAG: hypothetical protein PVF58_13280 [Candidatus Methanofastidiosia archaeon]|jgi:hypothetical protein
MNRETVIKVYIVLIIIVFAAWYSYTVNQEQTIVSQLETDINTLIQAKITVIQTEVDDPYYPFKVSFAEAQEKYVYKEISRLHASWWGLVWIPAFSVFGYCCYYLGKKEHEQNH